MERDLNQSINSLCKGGCGFYGSPNTDGLCSKCFKDALQRKQNSVSSTIQHPPLPCDKNDKQFTIGSDVTITQVDCDEYLTAETQSTSSSIIQPNEEHGWPSTDLQTQALQATCSSSQLENTNRPNDGTSLDQNLRKSVSFPSKSLNRCHQCHKKVGFTGFDCRCGMLFCGVHRYSDMHNCTFDYKSFGAEEIKKNNPVVKREKVEKI